MAGNRDLWIRIGARVDGFMAGIGKAQGGVRGFVRELEKSEQKQRALDDIGTKMGLIGAAATAATGFAIKAAMDWETAWTGVLKTVDGTESELATLEGSLRDLAKETGFAHAEVAAVAEAAGQLGISTPGVAKFTETMLAMGVSTNLGAEEAATGLARFRNIMGSTEGDIGAMGSTIVGLGNNFATTEAEILAMSLRLAGAGRQAGLTEADVMGVAAAMSSVGIEAEAGGTAMSLTMKRIGAAVDEGGSTLAMFAQVAGMSAQEFQTAWSDDAAGTLTKFVAGLDEAGKSGLSVNAILGELGITGIREADALLRLSGNAEGLADALGMAGDEWERNGALADEAGKFYGTSAQQVKQAWASIKDAAIEFGAVALPVVVEVAEAVAAMADFFGDLPGPVKGALTAIVGFTGVTLLAAAGLTKLTTTAIATNAALQTLGVNTSGLRGKMATFAKGAGVAAVAVGGVAAAFAALDRDSAAGVEEMTGAILDLSAGTDSLNAKMSNSRGLVTTISGIDQFSASIKEAHKGTNGFNGAMGSFFGAISGGALNPYKDAIEDIEAYDAALVSMVSSGALDQAADGHRQFAEAARDLGLDTSEINDLLPGYTEALRGIENETRLAAESTDTFSESMDALAANQEEAQKAAMDTAEGFMAFGSSLDDTKVSLREWLDELASQAKALQEFGANAETAAKRGLDDGLIASLEAMGPAGALRMKQLANASDTELKRANKVWRDGEKAVGDYIAKVGGVPDSKMSTIKVRTEGEESLRRLRGLIDGINGKAVRVVAQGTTGGGLTMADGGTIDFYANGGVGENHVAQIAPAGAWRVWAEPETGGEAYIPLHPSKRSRSIDIWAETGRRLGMSFADGGFSGELTATMPRDVASAIERGVERGIERGMSRVSMHINQNTAAFRAAASGG